MKFSLMLDEDNIQFNLTPENHHEKEFSTLLQKYKGSVIISNGADIGLCQGGYLRSYNQDSNRTIAITIKKVTKTLIEL